MERPPDVEHEVEVRRGGLGVDGRSWPAPGLLLLVVVGAVLAFVLVRDDGDAEPAGGTDPSSSGPSGATGSSSSTADGAEAAPDTGPDAGPTTTLVPPAFPTGANAVLAVVDSPDGVVVVSSAASEASVVGDPVRRDGTPVLATGGDVVVLDTDGRLRRGNAGSALADAGCCYDDVVVSNEPGHVWGIDATTAVLVDLFNGPTGVTVDLGTDRVVGLGTFGLVTVADDGTATWRRPSFDPTPIGLPSAVTVLGSGGEVVLVATDDGSVELRRVVDGSDVVLRLDPTPPAGPGVPAAVVASDGSAVAVRARDGWDVVDVASASVVGRIEGRTDLPVWIGSGRFAVVVDGDISISDGTTWTLAPAGDVTVALQAPG